jgi:hypothetical protein
MLTLIIVRIKLTVELMKTTCLMAGHFIERVSFREEIISSPKELFHNVLHKEFTMTKTFACLSVVLLLLFAAVNVASADEAVAKTAVVTESVVAPCDCSAPHFDPGHPPIVYRRGLFGVYRPVIYAPAYYPVYPPRYVRTWYPVYPVYHW